MSAWSLLKPQAKAACDMAGAAAAFFKEPSPELLSALQSGSLHVQADFPQMKPRAKAAVSPLASEVWDQFGVAARGARSSVEEALRLAVSVDRFMAEMSGSCARAAEFLLDALKASNADLREKKLVEGRNWAVSVAALARKARLAALEGPPVEGLKAQAVYEKIVESASALADAAQTLAEISAERPKAGKV